MASNEEPVALWGTEVRVSMPALPPPAPPSAPDTPPAPATLFTPPSWLVAPPPPLTFVLPAAAPPVPLSEPPVFADWEGLSEPQAATDSRPAETRPTNA